MGCTKTPLEGGSAHPISVLSESAASYLCYLMLTCTHSNDATHSSRYLRIVVKPAADIIMAGTRGTRFLYTIHSSHHPTGSQFSYLGREQGADWVSFHCLSRSDVPFRVGSKPPLIMLTTLRSITFRSITVCLSACLSVRPSVRLRACVRVRVCAFFFVCAYVRA